ncbi:MAG: hypothetical protein Q9187_003801 [Circinaria calcarea]
MVSTPLNYSQLPPYSFWRSSGDLAIRAVPHEQLTTPFLKKKGLGSSRETAVKTLDPTYVFSSNKEYSALSKRGKADAFQGKKAPRKGSKCLPKLDTLLKSWKPKKGKGKLSSSKGTTGPPAKPAPGTSRKSKPKGVRSEYFKEQPHNFAVQKRGLSIGEVQDRADGKGVNAINVPSGEADLKIWFDHENKPVTEGSLGTTGLCGCTVILIWSPYATFIAHVYEARVEWGNHGPWWLDDATTQAAQRGMDATFLREARNMLDTKFRPNAAYYFPPAKTQALIIAPHFDPRYYRHLELESTNQMPRDYFYPKQIEGLKSMLAEMGYRGASSREYHPRDGDSPNFRVDDRDLVMVNVETENQRKVLRLYMNGQVTSETKRIEGRGPGR